MLAMPITMSQSHHLTTLIWTFHQTGMALSLFIALVVYAIGRQLTSKQQPLIVFRSFGLFMLLTTPIIYAIFCLMIEQPPLELEFIRLGPTIGD